MIYPHTGVSCLKSAPQERNQPPADDARRAYHQYLHGKPSFCEQQDVDLCYHASDCARISTAEQIIYRPGEPILASSPCGQGWIVLSGNTIRAMRSGWIIRAARELTDPAARLILSVRQEPPGQTPRTWMERYGHSWRILVKTLRLVARKLTSVIPDQRSGDLLNRRRAEMAEPF